MELPVLIAHRGAMAEAPENTMAAFEKAASYPAVAGFEFDIQLSKDGVPIVYHDRTLKKVIGEAVPASSLTVQELSRIDWGGWYGSRFAGESLTTLEQMLTRYAADKRLLVEIKSYPDDRKNGRAEQLTKTAVNMLQSVSQSTVCVLSFDEALLDLAVTIAPELRYILNVEAPFLGKIRRNRFPDYLYGVGASIKALDPSFAETLRQRGLKVMTYSCNTVSQVERALACKVDILLSDDPGFITRRWG